MPRFYLVIFIFLSFSLGSLSTAQSPQEKYFQQNIEQHRFDDEKYNALTKDLDYTEEKIEKKKKEKEGSGSSAFKGIGPVLKFIIIILGVAVIAFLLIMVLTGENVFLPKDRKVKPIGEIDLEKIEDNLENTELSDPIKQAIAAGDYPLAVRLYYLSILKELSLQKKIKWKKDKTNGEYLRELAGSPFFKEMQKTTLLFEKIWYGKVELTQADFLLVEPAFVKFINEIKK